MIDRMLRVLLAASCALGASAAPAERNSSELIGTWRGTSTCSDRVAAPACRDEVVVYEFTAGATPGTVRWKADKVVGGERQTMGEMELNYDAGHACWAAEFVSPRARVVWSLVVEGAHLTGTGRQIPGDKTIRKIDARKD
jgi:hypothetical protein